jgi:beta-N-acetylhexosaminidase
MSEPAALRRAILTTLMPGFVGLTVPAWLDERLREGLGGVCIFGSNIRSLEQLRELTDSIYAANPLALIAIDEEGGDVTRLYYAKGSPLPGNAILGRENDLAYTERIATRIGKSLRHVGVNLDFAPDADINSNPDNPVIGTRSFGTDPAAVAAQVAAWTRGLQSTGVAACSKHFPGHGDTAQDSHKVLPVVDASLDELRERELVPFVAAIGAGTKTIMSSHIMLPQLDADRPATLSRRILQGLLRDELGFEGVIVSDALDMAGASATLGIPEAAVRALDAGCDHLCIGSETTEGVVDEIEHAVLAAVEDGRLAVSRVLDAAQRVEALAEKLLSERAVLPEIGQPTDAHGDPVGDPADDDVRRAIAAFDIRDAAKSLVGARTGNLILVRIETGTNVAVGTAPWGPAVSREPAGRAANRWATVIAASSASGAELDSGLRVEPGDLVVAVGRDIHRHESARTIVDRLRAEHPAIIAVDMGWPSDDRRYADIATFGASRLVGRALTDYLAGRSA